MPLAAAADMLVAQAIGAGYTEDDFATLVLEQARRSGYRIEPENVPVDDGLAPDGGVARVTGLQRPERPSQRPPGVRPIGAPGHMGVDYEERVDFARLRDYRINRATEALRATECGAFLLFDFYNIRYTTQTWIGGALGDKMIRYALLFRDRDPIEWDFGSAVRHHQLYSRGCRNRELAAGLPRLPRRGRARGRAHAGRRHRDQVAAGRGGRARRAARH